MPRCFKKWVPRVEAVGPSPSICIIGGGLSGMCAAIQLKRKLGIKSFKIFDTNKDFGGTWCVNTYPGCRCDLPVHAYSFSFEPKSDWKCTNASQPEIFEYYQEIARKHNLYDHFYPNHAVKTLRWMEEDKQWKVRVFNLVSKEEQDLYFNIVMSATGNLRFPNVPPTFLPFQGPIIHSAAWDPTLSLEGKVVAIVGSGSTAVQLIPAVSEMGVKKLLSYQRTAAWLLPQPFFNFSPLSKWAFQYIPGLRKAYRWTMMQSGEMIFPIFRRDKLASHIVTPFMSGVAKAFLALQVREPGLREKLKPDYRIGCKRVCVNNAYYSTFLKPHVHLVRQGIKRVTATSIVTEDGEEEEVDVLLLATGFKGQEYFGPMRIYGRGSKDILQDWVEDKPKLYKAIISADMPNLFSILGPGADIPLNSLVFMTECQVGWILKVLGEMIRRGAVGVEVREEVQENYVRKREGMMKKTIWDGARCDSIFSNARGVVTIKHYDSLIGNWNNLRRVKFENFNFIAK